MVTFGFILVCIAGFIFAVLGAAASHFAHAYLQPYPEQIFDGGRPMDHLLNDLMSPNYTPFGQYDEFGHWDFYSLYNFGLHLGGWLICYVLFVFVYWPNRDIVVAKTCAAAQVISLTPIFCHG